MIALTEDQAVILYGLIVLALMVYETTVGLPKWFKRLLLMQTGRDLRE